jgi:NAD(P) transhydrogenase subunit alpha
VSPLSLVIVFVIATIVGYKMISAVPSLLHTPLMSGTNALSGITVLGALAVTAMAQTMGNCLAGRLLGAVAVVLAMINVVGGFLVTDRMLRMFKK